MATYFLVDWVLYYKPTDTPGRRRLVVPKYLQKAVLDEGNDPVYAGHFSAKNLIQKISLMYYWPGMRGDVYKKCARCVACASVQGQGRRAKPPLHSIPVNGPFHCIGMDHKKMELSRRGNRYALVQQYYLTKWPEVYVVPDRRGHYCSPLSGRFSLETWSPSSDNPWSGCWVSVRSFTRNYTGTGSNTVPYIWWAPRDGWDSGEVKRYTQADALQDGIQGWDDLLGPVLFAY